MDWADACALAKGCGKPTWAQRAYDVLKARGRITTREMAAALGCARDVASAALAELHKRGCSTRHLEKNGFACYHEFIKGSPRPLNLKGHVGDGMVTARNALAEKVRMRQALKDAKRSGGPAIPRPVATTALEQAWGWVPVALPVAEEVDEEV